MIILSKYKDYYDYLQGIIGRDEQLILDRTGVSYNAFDYEQIEKLQNESPCKIELIIGTQQFSYILYKGKGLKTVEELKAYPELEIVPHDGSMFRTAFYRENFNYYVNYSYTAKYYSYNEVKKVSAHVKNEFFETKELTIKPKEDYLIQLTISRLGSNTSEKTLYFPQLSQFGVSNVLPPYEIWNLIYNELCKRKDNAAEVVQTDKEKIVGKGFDLKHSFRNTK